MAGISSIPQWQHDFLNDFLKKIEFVANQYRFSTSLQDELSRIVHNLSICREDTRYSETETDSNVRYVSDILASLEASLPLFTSFTGLSEDNNLQLLKDLECVLTDLKAEIGRQSRTKLTESFFGLYVIVDPEVTNDRPVEEISELALQGGARIIQLRDKRRDKGESLRSAWALQAMSIHYRAIFIINDHADIASLVNASGLHVGQNDLPIEQARFILNPHQLVGRSNNTLNDVLVSVSQGADHVALGPIFPTTTKDVGRPIVGVPALRKVKEAINVPIVAIGGINADNITEVVQAGADSICVSSSIGRSSDPRNATKRLIEQIRNAGGKV